MAATECPHRSASVAKSFHISSLPAHEQSPMVEIMPIRIGSLILSQELGRSCEFDAHRFQNLSNVAAVLISGTPGATRNGFGSVQIGSDTFAVHLRQAVSDVLSCGLDSEE
jgi:hypothetical protein